MPRARKKPLLVRPGQAQRLRDLMELLLQGEGGIECTKSGNVWSIALRSQKTAGNVPGTAAAPNERAKITDYSSDDDHYLGQRIDSAGNPIKDQDGNSPIIDLYCWKYGPDVSKPIHEWAPPVRPNGPPVPIEPITIEVGGEDVTRWYIAFGFSHIGCTLDGG